MRATIAGILLALVASGLAATPAAADDRGILEHDVPVSLAVHGTAFYPVQDGYRDYLQYRLYEDPDTDELMRSIDFSITSSTGRVVEEKPISPAELQLHGEIYYSWDGRIGYTGKFYPEGDYTISFDIVDRSHDHEVLSKTVRLDMAHWRYRNWHRTFRAADTVIDRDIGSCGSLKRPARAGWRGSIGYRSSGSCGRRRQSYAVTLHGVDVPPSPSGDYTGIRLDMYGGNARNRRYSTLDYALLRADDRWQSGFWFESPVRRHEGYAGAAEDFLRGTGDDKHFVWSVGVGGGAGYDVKTFTVHAFYKIFV